MNNLSVERFNRSEDAGKANPKDALTAAINEIDKYKVKSVMIIAVVDDDESVTYFAGPHVATLQKVWMVLQHEVLRIVTRIIERN